MPRWALYLIGYGFPSLALIEAGVILAVLDMDLYLTIGAAAVFVIGAAIILFLAVTR